MNNVQNQEPFFWKIDSLGVALDRQGIPEKDYEFLKHIFSRMHSLSTLIISMNQWHYYHPTIWIALNCVELDFNIKTYDFVT